MKKILLDTDIGSDIDDAVCLAYLLMQPEAELLGITTVTGQSILRAQMTDAICKAAGRVMSRSSLALRRLCSCRRVNPSPNRLSSWIGGHTPNSSQTGTRWIFSLNRSLRTRAK